MALKEIFTVTPDIHASAGKRVLNFIIDRVMFYIIFLGLIFIIALLAKYLDLPSVIDFILQIDTLNRYEDILFTAILLTIYYFLFEVFSQRTIGKFITKTKVVDLYGNKPTTVSLIRRSLARFIPFEIFSFLSTDVRGWHDTLSKTYVVDLNKFKIKKIHFEEMQELGKIQETNNT